MVLDGHALMGGGEGASMHSMYNLRHVGHEHDVVVEAHWSSQRGTIMS